MKTAIASTLVVLPLIAMFVNRTVHQMNSSDQQTIVRSMTQTLGRVAPVSDVEITIGPLSLPQFCWKFYRPHPDVFRFLEQALNDFQGDVFWTLMASGEKETCLTPTLGGRPTFYRADSRRSVTTGSVAPITTETRQRVFQDLQRLSGFLSNWFDQHTPPKATADNYLEPGVHGVWLVKRPEDFLKYEMDQRQALARELPFGVSLIELSAIFSRATSIQIDQRSSPLLWRLHDPWDDASYLPAEIELLNREVSLAESITSEPNARKGLQKLRQICDLATQADSGIYFLAK